MVSTKSFLKTIGPNFNSSVGFKETFCTDHWRCRFKPNEGSQIIKTNIIELLSNALVENIDTIKTENLYSFDGKAGYSLGQGQ